MAAAKEINTDAAAVAVLSGRQNKEKKNNTRNKTALKVFKCGRQRFRSRLYLNVALAHGSSTLLLRDMGKKTRGDWPVCLNVIL